MTKGQRAPGGRRIPEVPPTPEGGPPPLPADVLQRSPAEAVRHVAFHYLEEAHAASRRLDDPDDEEALHDFRVAVRRARSTLRAWRHELKGSVRKKHRRALRALQNATGGGRDAEVALDWLAGERAGLASRHRRGHEWLVERLSRRRAEALASARADVRRGFEAVRETLSGRLRHVRLEIDLEGGSAGPSFGEALAARSRDGAADLTRRLAAIDSAEDEDACHQARIAGKRLRYLLEPVCSQVRGAPQVVKRCKRLQDALGDLHDAHVLREELREAVESADSEQARRLHALAREGDGEGMRRESRRGARPGLLELTRRVQARIDALFAGLQEEWLSGGAAGLRSDVERLAVHLERARRSHLEIERKYLLRGLPARLAGAEREALEVDQGWLPGQRLRERIRRVRDEEGTTYFRTVKLGSGVERIEIEETSSPELFDRLWALTKDRRIRKRRYLVPDGEHVWEIDEFLDRDLVLAEVELERASIRPEIPEWLAPYVVREVTDDPRYTNFELARVGDRAPGP